MSKKFLGINIASTLGCILLVLANLAWADVDADITTLQNRWAEINYQLEGKTQQTAFEALVESAEKMKQDYPESAPIRIWSGIIKSTYAGAKGGFGALKLAKASKADLEKALELDPGAMSGSAYTSLGALYASVPGWPVGFGDDDKARELLLHGLEIDPDGIDSNYFYGDFLMREKDYKEAEMVMLRAQKAAPRPGRELADQGRQQEISNALEKIRDKLKK